MERVEVKLHITKSISVAMIMIILTLSIISTGNFLVKADQGGTGKFLEIKFTTNDSAHEADLLDSNCRVNAIKVSSDQIFTYVASDSETYSQKVGAGTVLLDAVASNEWVFSHFVIRGIEYDDLTYYKTEKYDVVEAVFDKLFTYDIEVYVVGGKGEIQLGGQIVATESNNEENPATVTVDWGSSPKFEFIPHVGTESSYHLSAVLVDGTTYVDLVLTDFTQSYQFNSIKEAGHSLAVTFSVDGQADIAGGSDVTVFLSSAASLTFDNVGDGFALGKEILSISSGDVIVWEITVDATLGPQVIVALRYDDAGLSIAQEENLRMYRGDVDYELWLRCDFNNDGVIDGQDVKVISNIVKLPKFLPDPVEEPELYQWYLDHYDLDGSGTINELDIHVVNSMKNIEWVDITYGEVDTINNIIYGVTDRFSIFRGR